jgi:hypothetical protein
VHESNHLNMKWLRVALEIIGALLLIVAVAAGWSAYSGTSEKVNAAKPKDVLFILNWTGISTQQDYKVLASYQSSRSATGAHLDFYCIELSQFEATAYAKTEWEDAPETDSLLVEALEQGVNAAREHNDCFPSGLEANAVGMKITFRSVVLNDRHPTSADIILYDPKSSKLYYVSYKT